MRAYLTAVSVMALSLGLCACGDFPQPVYPVSPPPAPAEPTPAPQPAPQSAPAAQPAPAPTDDTPKAHPTAPIEQSTLPPPAAPKPGARLDRRPDLGRPAVEFAVWRKGDDVQVYPAATHHRKKKSKAADEQTVTVAKGDTLASIARAHGTSIEALARLNSLRSPYRLAAGQTLKLSGAASGEEAKGGTAADKSGTVTVARGDTLASISRKNGVSIGDLAKINGLDEPYRLKVGQTIRLKAVEEAAASDDASPKARGKARAVAAEDDAGGATTSTITVRRRDTIQSVARQAHVSVAELARLNHLKKPYRVRPGQQIKLPDQPGSVSARAEAADDVEPAAPTVVVAGRKDTLRSIAARHGVSVETLARLNHLKRPYRIHRGQKIRLPGHAVEQRAAESSYRVQSGDTLYSIARRFGTDARSLAALNGMDEGDRLTVGRRVRLPGGAEDRIAPRPSRSSIASSAEPAAPVPYASLSGSAPTAPTPSPAPPSSTPSESASAQAAPYRPSAPVAEAPAPGDAEVAAAGKGLFEWPVKGDILQRFGPLAGGQRSDGVDIGDAVGTPVVAAAAGEVVYAGNSVPTFGNMVLIRHDGGWVTVYAHLASLDVKMRQTVTQGQMIGAVGQSGGVSQPQLHFEVRYAPNAKDKPRTIDPMLVLPQ